MERTTLSNFYHNTFPGAYWPGKDSWRYENIVFGKPKNTFVRKAKQTPTPEQMKERSDKYKLKFNARIEPIKSAFIRDNPLISPESLAELEGNTYAMFHVSAGRTLLDAALPIP
jgi:hypothetical protein